MKKTQIITLVLFLTTGFHVFSQVDNNSFDSHVYLAYPPEHRHYIGYPYQIEDGINPFWVSKGDWLVSHGTPNPTSEILPY